MRPTPVRNYAPTRGHLQFGGLASGVCLPAMTSRIYVRILKKGRMSFLSRWSTTLGKHRSISDHMIRTVARSSVHQIPWLQIMQGRWPRMGPGSSNPTSASVALLFKSNHSLFKYVEYKANTSIVGFHLIASRVVTDIEWYAFLSLQ